MVTRKKLLHLHAHDYPYLIRRWRKLAPKAGLKLEKYASAGGYDLFCLVSRKLKPDAPAMYFSAGVHGDEAAATEGLIEWAEKHPEVLRAGNVLIFPCVNAWGLVNNCRRDAEGRDLNRSFHLRTVPQIAAQLKLLTGRKFDLAMTLHEDYDAPGVYIYEVPRLKPFWAESLIRAALPHVPGDSRRKIEGRPARGGVVRPAISRNMMPEWPEAFALYYGNATRVFTVETPSEFHLDDRIAAQAAILTKAVTLCGKEFSLRAKPGAA